MVLIMTADVALVPKLMEACIEWFFVLAFIFVVNSAELIITGAQWHVLTLRLCLQVFLRLSYGGFELLHHLCLHELRRQIVWLFAEIATLLVYLEPKDGHV